MPRWTALLFFAMALQADERWVEFRSGPFEVLSSAGERPGRETLEKLEQFRHALGTVSGKADVQTIWPIRILVFKSAQQQAPYASPAALALARETFAGSTVSGAPLPRPMLRDCALLLLTSGSGRRPSDVEQGLADLFSTLEIDGQHMTLGRPPPAAERNKRWAKMHMLAVTPDYYGKLRVLVRNLERGVETEPAYRNAFAKSPSDIDKEAEAYLAAGNFGTVPISGRPLSPERDFKPLPVTSARGDAALADLLLGNRARAAEVGAAFGRLLNESPAVAREGLGLLALREQRTDEAGMQLAAAVDAKTTSARALVEYAHLESDAAKARPALEQAVKSNPRWAAPHRELAKLTADPTEKAGHLKAATSLDPSDTATWIALADVLLAGKEFSESAKAWAAAERAAADDAERERIRQARAAAQRLREDQEIAERKRQEDEKRRELDKLKEETLARIRQAEAKANVNSPPPDPNRKVEEWWDDPRPRAKLLGTLQKIDCLGKRFRLVIAAEGGKTVRIMLSDPKRVVITGGEHTLGCGPQKPARKVNIEYVTTPDPRQGTEGEAVMIEFP